MDDDLTPFEELGPTRRSTCYDEPQPKWTQPIPGAAVQASVARIGLRYRPTERADLEAHAARLALLAADLFDVLPEDIDRAAVELARETPFMPKASDVMAKVELYEAERRVASWKATAIEYTPREPEPLVEPCSPEAAAAILREFGLRSAFHPEIGGKA